MGVQKEWQETESSSRGSASASSEGAVPGEVATAASAPDHHYGLAVTLALVSLSSHIPLVRKSFWI